MNKLNEERFFICSKCFGTLSEWMLGNTKLVKGLGLPNHLTVHPVDSTAPQGNCERCNKKTADGYIPLAKPEQVVVS